MERPFLYTIEEIFGNSSDSGHWGTQRMPPLLFKGYCSQWLIKNSRWRSERTRNLVTNEYVKVN